jgi:hypothetical protein
MLFHFHVIVLENIIIEKKIRERSTYFTRWSGTGKTHLQVELCYFEVDF